MRGKIRLLGYSFCLSLAVSLFLITAAAAADPAVTITSPASTGVFETDADTVTLSGKVVSDCCGLRAIDWSIVSQGKTGLASGQTNNWMEWSWEAKNIRLIEGTNLITVTAEDAAGNLGEAEIDVTYTPPYLPPPIDDAAAIDLRKAKFTFYFGGPDYDDTDCFSIVAYLQKKVDEDFVMPFREDVTVLVHASGVEEPLFTQTIPAGTLKLVSTKFRYTGYPPGIRELTFEKHTSTSVYMYLFVEKWNFLPLLQASMTPAAYLDFVRSINRYTFTVLIGTDKAWQGSGPLSLGTGGTHKQELVHNR